MRFPWNLVRVLCFGGLCWAAACGVEDGDHAMDDASLRPVEAGQPSEGVRDAETQHADAGTAPPSRDAAASAADAAATRDAGRNGFEAGQSGAPAGGDAGVPAQAFALECGAAGVALESAGDPKNRINYVIVGDGYLESELDTTYLDHVREMLRVRFLPELEPYPRYRKFINICALKVPSNQSGIGPQAGDTAFGGYGNDETRLGYIEDDKVSAAITRLLPKEIEVDFTGVVLNSDSWWNAGGRFMVWSGAHKDAGLAAMHEGGHSFQRLADEYGGDCTFSGDEAQMRINVTKDGTGTAGKWSKWLDFTQMPGTGEQGIFEGAQYCDRGAFRPSQDSVMNSLWRSSYFNAISLEQAVRLIYDVVRPIDDNTPEGATDVPVLRVSVVDPAVIKIDWYIDDSLLRNASGDTLEIASLDLASGPHTVRARAYDDTPWVRGDRTELEQSVEWTVEVP